MAQPCTSTAASTRDASAVPVTAAADKPAETEPDRQLITRIEHTLANYLARRIDDATAIHPVLAEAAGTLTEFVLGGGKRIRPTFAWWGWRGAGGDPHDVNVLQAVSALELVQASALVHDDLIDASDTRRGRPTLHVEFAGRHERHSWRGASQRFGAAAAILLGDLALAWADDMFNHAELSDGQRRRIRPVWAGMRTDMLGGQYLDSWCQASGADTVAAALRVNRFKTAAYTVERPLQLGAALAGAPRELVTAYRRFGVDIGTAFQLRDDLLGVFGDPQVTGKPVGDDLREGKRTVLMALAIQTARTRRRTAEAEVLTSALGDPELDAEGVDRVRNILCELGASAEVERYIEQLTKCGLAALASAEVAQPAAWKLAELALAATRRRH
ncbi:MAG: polyprenyl synthetase family protein [Pseudonocardia sp.]|nr:polyprenyl synthetase family protein [Pseudonocardia sp.]